MVFGEHKHGTTQLDSSLASVARLCLSTCQVADLLVVDWGLHFDLVVKSTFEDHAA